jgi:GTP cyclohydrolase II
MLSPKPLPRAPLAIAPLLDAARSATPDSRAQAPAVSVRSLVSVPLRDGVRASFISFNGLDHGAEHFALRFGVLDAARAPVVRLHSECVTGDVFGSLRCDCGAQLQQAIDVLQSAGGILLYLRQEGRGIGLAAKLEAYGLQDRGLDTYAANRALELPEDARDYGCGAAMLKAMNVRAVRLLSSNPDKADQLRRHGIDIVEQLPTGTFLSSHNRAYLKAKAEISGHHLAME